MSSQTQPGGTYGSNLAEQVSVDAMEPDGYGFLSGSEYNRQKNWDVAAQLERTERGNLYWWTSKNRTEAK